MPTDLLEASSDAALVVAVARRNERALAELYRRHADALMSLAVRVLRDRTLAADIVQEVFVRLWQRPERFDAARGSLRAYLLADAHGRSVDVVRSETARRRREERDLEERLTLPSATAEDEALTAVGAEEVREALEALTGDERRAIELAYFDGLSYREVAVALDEPEGTIKSRIRTGLAKLRDTMVMTLAVIS